jgi:primary-amine oxidase
VHAGGDGPPRYIKQNRDIENQDIVAWHGFGHPHVCQPEDFPVMPVEYAGFTLKPDGFFRREARARSACRQERSQHRQPGRGGLLLRLTPPTATRIFTPAEPARTSAIRLIVR